MQNEIIDTGGQEAPDGVIGRFDDRFPLHIERGVQQHGNAGDRFEFREQRVQAMACRPRVELGDEFLPATLAGPGLASSARRRARVVGTRDLAAPHDRGQEPVHGRRRASGSSTSEGRALIRSPRCARTASGHGPPSRVMNARRLTGVPPQAGLPSHYHIVARECCCASQQPPQPLQTTAKRQPFGINSMGAPNYPLLGRPDRAATGYDVNVRATSRA
jgi:hypothetical protein